MKSVESVVGSKSLSLNGLRIFCVAFCANSPCFFWSECLSAITRHQRLERRLGLSAGAFPQQFHVLMHHPPYTCMPDGKQDKESARCQGKIRPAPSPAQVRSFSSPVAGNQRLKRRFRLPGRALAQQAQIIHRLHSLTNARQTANRTFFFVSLLKCRVMLKPWNFVAPLPCPDFNPGGRTVVVSRLWRDPLRLSASFRNRVSQPTAFWAKVWSDPSDPQMTPQMAGRNVFGGTPNTATGTVTLPNPCILRADPLIPILIHNGTDLTLTHFAFVNMPK